MRSRRPPLPWVLAALLTAGAAVAAPSQPVQPLPSRAEVSAAAEQVQRDPNLPGKRMARTLERKKGEPRPKADEPVKTPPTLGRWLKNLALWIDDAGRAFMWVLGALLVAVLAVGLRHWVRVRADARAPRPGDLPSHVRALDIRPESLPDRIGAAARERWLRGEHRTALSLLYRGALSRLVHGHAVPIRAASTEGDCLQLVRGRLGAEPGLFFERLVSAWQLAVYGGRLPESGTVLALCDAFDQQLAAAATPGAAR